jgi:hypothetical protein
MRFDAGIESAGDSQPLPYTEFTVSRPVQPAFRAPEFNPPANAALERAERLLATSEAQLDRADAKACHLLSAVGGATIVVFPQLTGGPVASTSPLHLILTGVGFGLSVVALGFLLLVLLPRLAGDPDIRQVSYFLRLRSVRPAQLAVLLAGPSRDPLLDLASRLYHTSEVLTAKYRFLRLALVCTSVSWTFLAAGLI